VNYHRLKSVASDGTNTPLDKGDPTRHVHDATTPYHVVGYFSTNQRSGNFMFNRRDPAAILKELVETWKKASDKEKNDIEREIIERFGFRT